MISDIIHRMAGKANDINESSLAAELEAFQPVGEAGSLEYASIIARNAGQVGRLVDDAKQRLADINAVIDAATGLRAEISTSLTAWEAALAVLMAPATPLAAKIAAAAAETNASAETVQKAAAKARKAVQNGEPAPVTRTVAGGGEYSIADVAFYYDKTPAEIINMSDDEFASLANGYDHRPAMRTPGTANVD